MTSVDTSKEKQKIVFLLTSVNDQFCGVLDYTNKLCHALREEGTDSHIHILPKWTFKSLFSLRKQYADNALFHLQYPSLGMGLSALPGLLPFFLPAGSHCYLTLHEFSVFNFMRKCFFFPHALFSKAIFFSNEFESRKFLKFFPFAGRKTHIVPIGSNIERVPVNEGNSKKENRLIYFGQIGENKGLEEFLETSALLKAREVPVTIAVIGAIMNPDSAIAKAVQQAADDQTIFLYADLDADSVSRLLAESSLAFLPFPDGISEKRGSALACMDHDVFVLTRHTAKTPDWMKKATCHVENPDDAAKQIEAFITNGHLNLDKSILQAEMKKRRWYSIAQRHNAIYKAL